MTGRLLVEADGGSRGNPGIAAGGAVVIDPAACGHHPLADLAMLTMFGAPGLEAILDSYAEAAHLPDDWRERARRG